MRSSLLQCFPLFRLIISKIVSFSRCTRITVCKVENLAVWCRNVTKQRRCAEMCYLHGPQVLWCTSSRQDWPKRGLKSIIYARVNFEFCLFIARNFQIEKELWWMEYYNEIFLWRTSFPFGVGVVMVLMLVFMANIFFTSQFKQMKSVLFILICPSVALSGSSRCIRKYNHFSKK